jgi:broad specificity phosphatase PhoE
VPDYQITLLRHGESEGNARHLFQGHDDHPLTEKGRAQANALALRWVSEGRGFDQVITSPLRRAQETACLAIAPLGLAPLVSPLWIEQDFGVLNPVDYTQMTEEQRRLFPAVPTDKMGLTGESATEMASRAALAAQDLLARPAGRYLIVSHGVMLNAFLCFALGIPLRSGAEGARFPHDNTGFTTLHYTRARHQWLLFGVNDRLHLNGHA